MQWREACAQLQTLDLSWAYDAMRDLSVRARSAANAYKRLARNLHCGPRFAPTFEAAVSIYTLVVTFEPLAATGHDVRIDKR
jgi:hypothetical protein